MSVIIVCRMFLHDLICTVGHIYTLVLFGSGLNLKSLNLQLLSSPKLKKIKMVSHVRFAVRRHSLFSSLITARRTCEILVSFSWVEFKKEQTN